MLSVASRLCCLIACKPIFLIQVLTIFKCSRSHGCRLLTSQTLHGTCVSKTNKRLIFKVWFELWRMDISFNKSVPMYNNFFFLGFVTQHSDVLSRLGVDMYQPQTALRYCIAAMIIDCIHALSSLPQSKYSKADRWILLCTLLLHFKEKGNFKYVLLTALHQFQFQNLFVDYVNWIHFCGSQFSHKL